MAYWNFIKSSGTFANGHSTTFAGASLQYADFGNHLDINYNSTWSVSFWTKATSLTQSFKSICGKAVASPYQGWEVQINNQKIEADIGVDSTHYAEVSTTSNVITSTASWFHVVVTNTGGGNAAAFAIYVGGSSVGVSTVNNTLSTGTVSNSANFKIATRDNLYYSGKLNHVSFWNITLSAGDVTNIFGTGHPGDLSTLANFSNCKLWCYLGDGDNATAASGFVDHSSSGFNGTGSGTPTFSTDVP